MPTLGELDGVDQVDTSGPLEVGAEYFDTADLHLLGSSITIRRQTGDDPGWYLQLPGGTDHQEVRLPLGRAVHTVPKPLRGAVSTFTAGEDLTAVARLQITRRLHRLTDQAGNLAAEITDDDVTAELSDGFTGGHHPPSWRQWQVRLVQSGADLHQQLLTALVEAGGQQYDLASGLAAALGVDVVDRPNPLQPAGSKLTRKSPASELIAARLADQVAEMRRLDPLVRLDITDSVHKMRVAIRRLRSALVTFGPLLDRAVSDPVRDELKWIATVLGEVRDTEVFHARVHQLNASQPQRHTALVQTEVMPLVDRVLRDRYRQAHHSAVEAMESQRYASLLNDLQSLTADPPWNEDAPRPGKEVLPERVAHDYQRLRRRIKAAQKADDGEQRDFLLHEARKAAKRARYAAETLQPAFGKDAERFAKALKGVQSSLGDHHDTAVSREELVELAAIATNEQVNPLALGLLYADEEANAAQAEAQFQAAWDKASQSKKRNWLK